MIISYITLLAIDNPHAVAVDIGIPIKPIPVIDKIIDLDFVEIITNVTDDFNNVVIVFLYFFLDLLFVSSKYVINSLKWFIELSKLLTTFSVFLIVVLNQYF